MLVMTSASGARAPVLRAVRFLGAVAVCGAVALSVSSAAAVRDAASAGPRGSVRPRHRRLPGSRGCASRGGRAAARSGQPGRGGCCPDPAGRSLNWAGYAASRRGVTFRSVSTTFFVPYLNCAKSPGVTLSSAWAGLDGFTATSQTVEQTGIAANCSAGGSASYFGWFEMFPNAETKIAMRLHPGDSVTATVSFSSGRGQFQLRLTDNTRGEHFARYLRCPA